MLKGPTPEPVSIPPTLTGAHGRAWTCDLDAARRMCGVAAEQDAMLASWVIEARWAHPFWHSYSLMVYHLRPLPDARPTKFYLAGATHEVLLYALNPEEPREPAIKGGPHDWLHPCNFAAQFIAADDAAAAARIEAAVTRIVNGTLSPDTDYIRHWMHLFGDNMVKGDKKRAGETRIIVAGDEIVIPPERGPQDLN